MSLAPAIVLAMVDRVSALGGAGTKAGERRNEKCRPAGLSGQQVGEVPPGGVVHGVRETGGEE
jgi:hypothetical protein